VASPSPSGSRDAAAVQQKAVRVRRKTCQVKAAEEERGGDAGGSSVTQQPHGRGRTGVLTMLLGVGAAAAAAAAAAGRPFPFSLARRTLVRGMCCGEL
jgi:hypothetical protein